MKGIEPNEKIPVFGGFIDGKKNINSNTAIDHEAEVLFFMDIWAFFESNTFGDDNSVISFLKAM